MAISVKTSYKPVVSSGKSSSSRKTSSSSKSSSSRKTSSSSKSSSSRKTSSSSKPASSSKTLNSRKSVSNNKPTISYTTASSCYKPANASKKESTYKPPSGYYSYKTTSTVYSVDKKKVATEKSSAGGSLVNTIKGGLKSKLIASTKICSATIESVKKKVEKSLSDTVMELRKSEDYLKRLNKVYKAGMSSAANQICNEVSDSIDLAKKAVKKKDGLGADAINLVLSGCEVLANTVIKGSMKLGGSAVSAVLNLSQKTIGAVEDVIDFINPAQNQLSVNQIIKKVENGTIKLKNNVQKGNYGEMKMDQYYSEHGYVRLSTDRVMSLDEPVHQGIDGIYYNVDKQKGEPTYIIAEAKYNQSKLGYTKYDGRQMSDTWILGNTRIQNAVGKDFEKQIKNAILKDDCEKQVVHVFPDGMVLIEKIM